MIKKRIKKPWLPVNKSFDTQRRKHEIMVYEQTLSYTTHDKKKESLS